MNVLFIISNFPPVVGGTERQALLLARTMRQQVINVEVLTRHWPGLKREDCLDGVSVHRRGLPIRGKIGSVVAAIFWAAFVLRYGRRYSVFHAHQPYSALWIALIVKLMWRKPVVVKIPGAHAVEHLEGSRPKRTVVNSLVDAVIVLNSDDRRELIEMGVSSTLRMIPNGVDIERLRPGSLSDETAKSTVVFAGRLIPSKGVDVLLESWQTVQSQVGDSLDLFIVGDGNERKLLERQATVLNLHRVHFTGVVENIQSYMGAAMVCVCPSRPGQEGISNVLLEAMALGRPIVASNVAGTRDVLVDGQNGLLVQPESPESMASHILKLLGDVHLRERLGTAARATVEQAYSIQAVALQYRKLYAELAQ